MLVLSRGKNDRVVFPTLGVSVEILRIGGNKVRIGIDAPDEIPVLRHEIAEQAEGIQPHSAQNSQLSHAIRNRLNTAFLGLSVLHKRLETDDADGAESLIFKIFNQLKSIEDDLDPTPRRETTSVDTSRRALLVEDDANESELFASYLRMSGFQVDTAVDGLQAMAHLSKNDRPDVVLMDMRMPRFDGEKAVATIRANPDYRDLKVFAVSGTSQSETQVSVGPLGVNRWFAKPVNPQNIVDAIHEELATECVSA
ncbi:MAG: response regulator [Pirellulales bacterium]|nr:response regulator [Pirellulales bacterium]